MELFFLFGNRKMLLGHTFKRKTKAVEHDDSTPAPHPVGPGLTWYGT